MGQYHQRDLNILILDNESRNKTHYQGHTLDVIVTRLVDNIVSSVKIDYSGYRLSDHAHIVCYLKIKKHQIDNRTQIKYRNITLIYLNVFSAFIADLVLMTVYLLKKWFTDTTPALLNCWISMHL